MPGPYALTGVGEQLIGASAALSVSITSLPVVVDTGAAEPTNYFHLGLMRLGGPHGYLPTIPLDADSQWIPVPPGADRLAYAFNTGVAVSVSEVAAAVPDPHLVAPWDRNPTLYLSSLVQGTTAGAAVATGLTYTVPAGRSLMLNFAEVRVRRTAVATTAARMNSLLFVNGLELLHAEMWSNVVGDGNADFASGPIYLPAGSVITWTYRDQSTAGAGTSSYVLAGTLFDA